MPSSGTPAKIIRYRFAPEIIDELLRLQWWNYGLSALDNTNFANIEIALHQIERNIASGHAQLYSGPILKISADEVEVLAFDPETGVLAA